MPEHQAHNMHLSMLKPSTKHRFWSISNAAANLIEIIKKKPNAVRFLFGHLDTVHF
jgi:hypothetical protein